MSQKKLWSALAEFLFPYFAPLFPPKRLPAYAYRSRRHRPSVAGVERLENRTLLSSVTAEVFHVAVNGNNAGGGTAESPWQTLQHAANQVGPGDTVIVHAGTYAGFDLRTDGTSEQRITFQGESGAIINQRNPITTDGINLEGADYVTIQGFHIVEAPRAGIRSVVNHHVTLRDNVFDQNGVWGVFTGFSDDLLIENNIASRSGSQHGIYVSNSGDRPVIRGNEIWGNYQNGIHINGDATAGSDGIISGALVEQNIIYDNGRGGGSAINADGVQDSRFANNLLYNNHASGISLYRIDGGGGSTGNTVINNTILQAADSRWGININDGSTNNTLLNNIIYSNHTWRGGVSIAPNSLAGLVSDYNVVMDRFSGDSGDSRLSLSQWQAATGQDTHSIIASPGELFIDPGNGDFHLRADSPAIDAGTALLASAVDREGDARPQGRGIDIGADEFLSDATPPEPAFTAGFDFGTGASPVAEGYSPIVGGSIYEASLGYGWTSRYWTGVTDRGGADALTRDAAISQAGIFGIDVPEAAYDVTLTFGDVFSTSDYVDVSLEGEQAGTLSAAAGEHISQTYRVLVTDGQLTIELRDGRGASRYFYLNAIRVEQVGGSDLPSDTTGPHVVSSEVLGAGTGTLDGFRLTFNEPIPDGGLQLDHLALAGPNGLISPTGLTRVSASEFEVHFPAQAAAGLYTLTLSPQVSDQAGNLLDQDGDGTGGETIEDRFLAISELFATDFQAGFDFGTATSPVADGYQPATPGTRYDSSRGFGWTTSYWMGTYDRGGSDSLTRDSNISQAGTFAVDLPNGTYDVTITIGDALGTSDHLSVSLENQEAGVISAAAGEHTSATYRVQVTDGQLTIGLNDLGGASRYFYLNSLQVRSV